MSTLSMSSGLPATAATAAAPTGLPVAPATPQGDPTSGFGALVAQLMGLAPTASTPVVQALPPADVTAPQEEDETVENENENEDALLDELAAMPTLGPALAAQLAVAALATRVNNPQAAPLLDPAVDGAPGTTVGPLSGQKPAMTSPTLLGWDLAVAAQAPTATATPLDATQISPTTAAQGPAEVGVPATTAGVGLEPVAGTASAGQPLPTTTDVAPPATGLTDGAGQAGQVEPLAPTTSASSLTSSAQAAPTAPTGVAPAPTAPAEVQRQVFPEITRLVSAGNGSHRITLELNPEALGEVRVTLIVRDGSVHVRLSAGDEAQRALLEGAPELRRLLEATGASDTKIVVRDLPAGSAPGGSASSTSQGHSDGGHHRPATDQAGTGEHDAPNQHAWTRDGGSTARDGISGGAATPRHVDQVTRARTTGVDVTV